MGRRNDRDAQRRSRAIGLATLLLTLAIASNAGAQVCGDADGSGTTSLNDGVQVLREAAGLGSACTVSVCDVDDSGAITVSDGVATLQRVAELPAESFSCGTRFGTLVKTIAADGVAADLQIGDLPTPDDGAPQNVVAFDGPTKVRSGQTASFVVQLARPVDSLVVAFQEEGSFVDGFAELPVAGDPGPIQLALTFGTVSATTGLTVAGRLDGRLGAFQTRTLSIANLDVIAGPIEYGGHTYLLLSEGGWVDSQAEAVALGGNLVTISDADENAFVFGAFGAFGSESRSLWIGLNDLASEGTYVWVSGEPTSFVAWEGRAPDDCCDSAPHGEDYVHIENGPCWPEPGRWNDLADRSTGRVEACSASGSVPVNGVVELSCTGCF